MLHIVLTLTKSIINLNERKLLSGQHLNLVVQTVQICFKFQYKKKHCTLKNLNVLEKILSKTKTFKIHIYGEIQVNFYQILNTPNRFGELKILNIELEHKILITILNKLVMKKNVTVMLEKTLLKEVEYQKAIFGHKVKILKIFEILEGGKKEEHTIHIKG